MNRRIATDGSASEHGAHAAAVEIGVNERYDALRVMEVLIPFHSFLVQYEREHWVVRARVPGCHGESLSDLLGAIERLRAGSGVKEFTCFLDDQAAAPAG